MAHILQEIVLSPRSEIGINCGSKPSSYTANPRPLLIPRSKSREVGQPTEHLDCPSRDINSHCGCIQELLNCSHITSDSELEFNCQRSYCQCHRVIERM